MFPLKVHLDRAWVQLHWDDCPDLSELDLRPITDPILERLHHRVEGGRRLRVGEILGVDDVADEVGAFYDLGAHVLMTVVAT